MIQHWKDVLLAAGYRKASTNDHYISPAGTHYGPEEVARLFGEAINMNQNPLTNAYLQAQNYNAQNNVPQAQVTSVAPNPYYQGSAAPSQYNQGLHPYQNPQHHGLGATGSGLAPPWLAQNKPPSWIIPQPSGMTAEAKIYDPALDEWVTIHIDTAFLPVLDYINDASHQARAKPYRPDDFSLDEVRQAEDMIAELNID